MSTQLEEAMKAGREDRDRDDLAEEAERAKRLTVREALVLKERALVKAGHYDLFTRVRKATRIRDSSFQLHGPGDTGWSPTYASIVGDAIRAEYPEFYAALCVRQVRDMCDTMQDEGSLEVRWTRG